MMSYAQWGNALYSGEKSYRIVPKRRIFVRAALAVIAICAILIGIFGLNRSFEFTGGSQFTLTGLSETSQQPAYDAIQKGNAFLLLALMVSEFRPNLWIHKRHSRFAKLLQAPTRSMRRMFSLHLSVLPGDAMLLLKLRNRS